MTPTRTELFAARLPLRARRRAVRASWRLAVLRGRAGTLGIAEALARTLRVPAREARRLDREAVFADRMTSLEWLAILSRSREALVADAAHVTILERGMLERVAAGARPVILAPLHMGSFALPFARLVHDVFPGRRMLILRAREDREIETRVMRRISEIGTDMRFLNVRDKQDYIDAVRFARAGAVIVSFVDLPASYGGPVDTTLFGRPARLAMGLDALARLTEATVVPLAVRSHLDGDVVAPGRPFEVAESGPEAKARVTDLVRRHIEASVLAAPEQWFMWQRLGEFLAAPEAAQERAA